MKTQEQLNYEFSTRQLLKMVPGGDNWYVAGNGRLNQVRPGGPNPRQPRPVQQPPPFRPEVPPPVHQVNPPVQQQAAVGAPVQGQAQPANHAVPPQ